MENQNAATRQRLTRNGQPGPAGGVQGSTPCPGFRESFCNASNSEGREPLTPEELESIYGPLYRYSDHKRGETLSFQDTFSEEEHSAEILWVQAPGQRVEGGSHHPATYIMGLVDRATGMLYAVAPADVLE
jgi:hypothetical protein